MRAVLTGVVVGFTLWAFSNWLLVPPNPLPSLVPEAQAAMNGPTFIAEVIRVSAGNHMQCVVVLRESRGSRYVGSVPTNCDALGEPVRVRVLTFRRPR